MQDVMLDSFDDFYRAFTEGLANNAVAKLLLSQYRGEDKDLERITIRPLLIQNSPVLSFVYQYKTNHVTKNYPYDEGVEIVKYLLGSDFRSAYLSMDSADIQLEISKKGKVRMSQHSVKQVETHSQVHNREKNRFVDMDRDFLIQLGVTDKQHHVIPAMSRKWKQINKFIEVFSQALTVSPLQQDQSIKVVDFGSGKGYLTFAIHDYLQHKLHNNAEVTGVELRQGLADTCNRIAATLAYQGLSFVCGDVKSHAPKQTDVMIALHACDIATDYAIHYGIRAQASIIMCSPCCHKQIRPQMQSPELFKPMLQYGVHMGQQAEMVTDSLRALFLEAYGYTTKVFEFISLEHTNKNKMILAIKNTDNNEEKHAEILRQITEIKDYYGIKEYCLENLLA
jgi:protein-L-isoaspartate O-methyltransferase